MTISINYYSIGAGEEGHANIQITNYSWTSIIIYRGINLEKKCKQKHINNIKIIPMPNISEIHMVSASVLYVQKTLQSKLNSCINAKFIFIAKSCNFCSHARFGSQRQRKKCNRKMKKRQLRIMPQILFVFVSPTVVQRNINQPYESVHK